MINVWPSNELVLISSGKVRLPGMLTLPQNPRGMVLFTHGSGSGRLSPHDNYIAGEFRRAGLGTLQLGLSGNDTGIADDDRIDIALLGARLGDAAHWLAGEPETKRLALGLFGTRKGTAAALQLAACRPEQIAAVVSRGGRPDLAGGDALARVRAPTLLIVGGQDHSMVDHNRQALGELACEKELAVIRGATQLFEERGALAEVARLAARWFKGYLGAQGHFTA